MANSSWAGEEKHLSEISTLLEGGNDIKKRFTSGVVGPTLLRRMGSIGRKKKVKGYEMAGGDEGGILSWNRLRFSHIFGEE